MNQRKPQKEPNILGVLGLFLTIFGLAVIVGVFYDTSYIGRIVNVVIGGFLMCCGAAGIFLGQKRKRNR